MVSRLRRKKPMLRIESHIQAVHARNLSVGDPLTCWGLGTFNLPRTVALATPTQQSSDARFNSLICIMYVCIYT